MSEQTFGAEFDAGFDLPEVNKFQTAPTPDFTVQANGLGFEQGTPSPISDEDYVDQVAQTDTDDLWSGTLDHEADLAAIKASLPPAGYYEVQGLAGTRSTREVEGRKRPTIRYYGKGIRYVDGVETTARIRFSICHVPFIKANGKGAWDYTMYLQAKRAYMTANGGTPPQTIDELDEYLSTATIKARITHTTDDFMVVGLEGVRV